MRRERLTELMLKQLGVDKIQALVSMAEGFEAQLKEKREELEVAQQFIQDAEDLNEQIHRLEQEYADARENLDKFNAENEWATARLKGIYERNPIREIVTAETVRGFPYEDRRLLLAATGLRVEVYPNHWPKRERETRFDVFCAWEVTSGDERKIVSRLKYSSSRKD